MCSYLPSAADASRVTGFPVAGFRRGRSWSGPLLAAYLSAHRTMINGSALCAALAVTERD